MADWRAAIDELEAVATVTPEYDVTNEDERRALKERTDELVERYPGIAKLNDYRDFLSSTGGLGADNTDFSMMLFGYGGYVVASFDEADHMDEDRYFLFGDVTYPSGDTIELAFDTSTDDDRVFCVHEEASDYHECAPSFGELLEQIASGRYPW